MGLKSFKVSIIGAGSMAREHIRAFQAYPEFNIVAIHSKTESKAKALADEFKIPLVCNTIAELYQNTQSDLVINTVPEMAKNTVTKEALKFPWMMLTEKPAGYSLKDFEDILNVAKEKKVFVGMNRRYYSSTRNALGYLAESSAPGQRFVRVLDQQDPALMRTFNHPEPVIENWMYANSIHVIDYFRIFCRGEVSKVTPLVKWNSENPGFVIAQVEFTSGDFGLYESVWNGGPGPWAVAISTSKELIEMRPLESATFQKKGERIQNKFELDSKDTEFKAGFYYQAGEILKALEGKAHSLVDMNDSYKTMKLVSNIFN